MADVCNWSPSHQRIRWHPHNPECSMPLAFHSACSVNSVDSLLGKVSSLFPLYISRSVVRMQTPQHRAQMPHCWPLVLFPVCHCSKRCWNQHSYESIPGSLRLFCQAQGIKVDLAKEHKNDYNFEYTSTQPNVSGPCPPQTVTSSVVAPVIW